MIKKALAEMIGTFALVLIGTGTVVLGDGTTGLLGIGFAFGLAVVAMAYSVGTISGAHLNPAVSLAMFINKRINLQTFAAYVVAQLVGAVAGSGVLRLILSQVGGDTSNLGATVLAEGVTLFGGFMIELILTFIFVMVILAATGKNGDAHFAGLIIGLTLVALILLGGTTTGVSLNPARSFGPAVFMGGAALSQLWMYTLATLAGGGLAAVVAKFVLDTEAGAPGVE
ncbi:MULTISPECIES: MIP/aquaporin family protein [unclassified Jeotgalibaca]|uniref:MIP/aquaporin family protein n=1 Tax=unclassified Jeotgalibaca TaxID=2621505 RepID=UPI003FD4C52C